MRQDLTRKTVANRCNFGILPLAFQNPKDHESIQPGDQLLYPDLRRRLEAVTQNSLSGPAGDGSSPCWKSQAGRGSTCWLAAPRISRASH
jgi:hypothetical protein